MELRDFEVEVCLTCYPTLPYHLSTHARGKSLRWVFFRLYLCESRDERELAKNVSCDQLVSPTIQIKKREGDHITETMGVAGRGR